MDLSFSRNISTRPALRAGAGAVWLAEAGTRQAASTTALGARELAPWHAPNPWMAPESGAFSAAMAAALTKWKQL